MKDESEPPADRSEPQADRAESRRVDGGTVLFECDQCTWRERRPPDQEPWPCPVCGWSRWSVVAE